MKTLMTLAAVLLLAGSAVAQNPQSDLPSRVADHERRIQALERAAGVVPPRAPQSDLPARPADPWARPDGMKAVPVAQNVQIPAVLTEAQFRALYPGIQLGGAVQGVTAAAPFVDGRYATPATSARTVVYPSTSRPELARSVGLTYTVVPTGTYGITSGGCAGGNCAAPATARRGLLGWR